MFDPSIVAEEVMDALDRRGLLNKAQHVRPAVTATVRDIILRYYRESVKEQEEAVSEGGPQDAC